METIESITYQNTKGESGSRCDPLLTRNGLNETLNTNERDRHATEKGGNCVQAAADASATQIRGILSALRNVTSLQRVASRAVKLLTLPFHINMWSF